MKNCIVNGPLMEEKIFAVRNKRNKKRFSVWDALRHRKEKIIITGDMNAKVGWQILAGWKVTLKININHNLNRFAKMSVISCK